MTRTRSHARGRSVNRDGGDRLGSLGHAVLAMSRRLNANRLPLAPRARRPTAYRAARKPG